MKSAKPDKLGSSLPSSVLELGSRLEAVADHVGGVERAAQMAGTSKAQYYRWENGQNDPSVSKIAMLARKAGVSPAWLVAGVGDMVSDGSGTELDVDRLERAIVAIEGPLQAAGYVLAAGQKAMAVAEIYAELEKRDEPDPDGLKKLLRLMGVPQ